MQQRTLSLRAVAGAGIVAGLVGAVTIDAYLLLTVVVAVRAATLEGFYQFVASSVIGPAAYASSAAVPLGIALHLAVSIAWGLGYAYVAARTPQVRERWFVSGIAFGVVVMIAMQLVEVAANVYHLPDIFTLFNGFVAHVAFFGIPVAYVASRRLEPAFRHA